MTPNVKFAFTLAILFASAPLPLLAAERAGPSEAASSAFQDRDYAAALAALERDLAACEASRPPGDECLNLVLSLTNVAGLAGQDAKALGYGRMALAMVQRLPPRHPDRVRALGNLGTQLANAGDAEAAADMFRQSLALAEAGPDTDPEQARALLEVALGNLAWLYRTTDRPALAEPLLRKLLAMRIAAVGDAPDAMAAATLGHLASVARALGRPAENADLAERAATMQADLAPGAEVMVTAYSNWGVALSDLGKAAEAEVVLRHVLTLWRRLLPPDDPHIAATLNLLALAISDQGRPDEAEPLLRQSIAMVQRASPADPLALATAASNLASVLIDQGRSIEAEPLARQALALRETAYAGDHRDIALSYNNLAYNLRAQGRFTEAEVMFRRALAMRRRLLAPGHPELAGSLNNVAGILDDLGRPAEAEPLYREAMALREAALPLGHPDIATAWNNLALNLSNQGRYAEAEPLLRKALAAREAALPTDHPDIAAACNNLGFTLNQLGRLEDALAFYRRAFAILRRQRGLAHPERIAAGWFLGTVMLRHGNSPAVVRSLYRASGAGALERLRGFTGFEGAAQDELRKYRPIFDGQVKTAWTLARPG